MGTAHDPIDTRVLTLLAQQLDDLVVEAIVAAYLGQAPQRSDELRAAMPTGGTALRDAAHSLAASSLTVGATRLGNLCRDIEAAVSGNDDVHARELAQRALPLIDEVGAALAATRWAPPAG
jgi:HPt (histidine-containing phosphotransfer) domain-containing protein